MGSIAESLSVAGLAPVSRVRVLAAVKSLFGFAFRMRHIPVNPAAELALPRYEVRLAERILAEEDVQLRPIDRLQEEQPHLLSLPARPYDTPRVL